MAIAQIRGCSLSDALKYPVNINNKLYEYHRDNSIRAVRKDLQRVMYLLGTLCVMWGGKEKKTPEDYMPWLDKDEAKVDAQGRPVDDLGLVDI